MIHGSKQITPNTIDDSVLTVGLRNLINNAVPNTRTVNGKALNTNITIGVDDIPQLSDILGNKLSIGSLQSLKNNVNNNVSVYYTTDTNKEGFWIKKPSSSKTVDDILVIQDSLNIKWERYIDKYIKAEWYDLISDNGLNSSSNDNLSIFAKLFADSANTPVLFPRNKVFYLSDNIHINSTFNVDFNNSIVRAPKGIVDKLAVANYTISSTAITKGGKVINPIPGVTDNLKEGSLVLFKNSNSGIEELVKINKILYTGNVITGYETSVAFYKTFSANYIEIYESSDLLVSNLILDVDNATEVKGFTVSNYNHIDFNNVSLINVNEDTILADVTAIKINTQNTEGLILNNSLRVKDNKSYVISSNLSNPTLHTSLPNIQPSYEGQVIYNNNYNGLNPFIWIATNNKWLPFGQVDRITINQFGAVGDNTTDNTVAFQNAIDYLISVKGGTIIIPTGIYRVEGTVYINPETHLPITIRGEISNIRNDNSLLSGPSIRRSTAGVMFKTNIKPDGSAFLGPTAQYSAFAVENLNFSGVGAISGVIAFEMFRTRPIVRNITTQRLDYLVHQPDTDSVGALNYCDQARYEQLRFTNSTKGGLRLRNADTSTIDMIFVENVTSTFENLITLLNTRGATVSNILHWTPTTLTPIAGSSLITLLTCSNIHISSMHFERVTTENIFTLGTCRGITIVGLDTVFESNNIFRFASNNRNINISNWNASSDLNAGMYDVVVNAGVTNREVTFYDYELLASNGTTTRQMTVNNLSTRQGGAIRFNQLKPYIIEAYDTLVLERVNSTVFLYDASDSAIKSINLPNPATNQGEKILFINRTTTTSYTITGLGNTEATFFVPRNTSTELISNGINWLVVTPSEIVRHLLVSGSANYTVPYYNAFLTLQSPQTTDREITLPSASARMGSQIIVHNLSTNLTLRWSATNIRNFTGTTGTYYFDPNTIVILRSTGSVWDIVSVSRSNPKRNYTIVAGTASFSAIHATDIVQLNPITGSSDLTLTLVDPSVKTGETITIMNRNESLSYKWNVSPAIRQPNGLDTSILINNSSINLTSDGAVWRVTSSGPDLDGRVAVSGTFNGSATSVSFAHNLGAIPVWFGVTPTNQLASGAFWVTATSTNIVINYASAPTAGTATYNISYKR